MSKYDFIYKKYTVVLGEFSKITSLSLIPTLLFTLPINESMGYIKHEEKRYTTSITTAAST